MQIEKYSCIQAVTDLIMFVGGDHIGMWGRHIGMWAGGILEFGGHVGMWAIPAITHNKFDTADKTDK